jgi:hypothetical protein
MESSGQGVKGSRQEQKEYTMSNEIANIIEKIENKIADKKAKIATETDAAAVAVLYVKIAAYEEILEDIKAMVNA